MKDRFILFLLLAAFISNSGIAQVSIGKSKIGAFKDFKKGEYALIKKKHTYFVVDDIPLQEFEDIVEGVWTINPYTVISREEFSNNTAKYITESNAIWQMSGSVRTSTSQSGMTTEYLYVYYEYYYPEDIKEKKGKLNWDKSEIAAIFMSGNLEAMWAMIRNGQFGNLENDLYHYKAGYLRNYIQYVNDNLANDGYSFAYDTDYDKTKIKKLAKTTLYVPDYIKMKTPWGWSEEEREDPNELFKKYPYKYEFISDDALNEKIMAGSKEDFYYLCYTKVNGQKMIAVINGKNGDIIYKDYQTMSYQLKTKDITELASKIKK